MMRAAFLSAGSPHLAKAFDAPAEYLGQQRVRGRNGHEG